MEEYEVMRATMCRDMIASKAAVEPMFNWLRSMVIPHVSARALAGTCIVGCTCAN
jgi:hypothetical protein